jgi:hypothetical protein
MRIKDVQLIAMHTDKRDPDMWQLYIHFYGNKTESETLMQRIQQILDILNDPR